MFFEKAFDGENEWWKWVLVPILAFFGYTIGQIPLTVAIFYKGYTSGMMENLSPTELEELLSSLDFAAFGIDLNVAFFLILLMFVFMAVALLFFHKVLHKRHWRMLITPLEAINWNKIFFSFFLWMGFTMVLELISYFTDPTAYTLVFDFWNFLPLLVIVILLMPIQTTTEELLFRGYLMQGFGIWTKSKLFAAVITSVLFGLMHIMNPEVKEFGLWIMMAYYMSVGFFLALLTIMDDSLELAIGVHAATNMFSALFVSYEGGALQTYAIFKTDVVNVGLMLPVFFVVATLFFVICWKKYNWTGWSKLLEPIRKPEPIMPPELPTL